MDLLAYAVNRKLKRAGDRLLDYVAGGEDVPVSVLEESLGELLGPLEDDQSTMLVEDYPQMLERYVPVHYTKHPETGAYEVGGEISDRLLEAMELVHGRGKDEVINELIENSTHSLTNSPTISVGELSLKQLSAQMSDLEESIPVMESYDEDEIVDEVIAELKSEEQEAVIVESEEPEVQSYDEPEVYETEEVEDEIDEVIPEETVEEVEEAVETVEKPVEIDEEIYENVPEDLPEDISPEEYAQAEQQLMTEGIRRVYNKLVADLKAHGLDEALGLSI